MSGESSGLSFFLLFAITFELFGERQSGTLPTRGEVQMLPFWEQFGTSRGSIARII